MQPERSGLGAVCHGPASADRAGSPKSILGSYISEFPLGDEAAFGIVEQYLNTCGEKSNIRMGTQSL